MAKAAKKTAPVHKAAAKKAAPKKIAKIIETHELP